MMDRLVCADGGNPDQTTTHGKKVAEAKALELNGWHVSAAPCRARLLGRRPWRHRWRRDAAAIADRLADRHEACCRRCRREGIDRYIGYYEPYATSHDALDSDTAVQHEVRQAAKALVEAIPLSRAGRFPHLDAESDPRPK